MTAGETKSSGSRFETLNRTFARIEEVGARIGLAFTLIGYALYISGLLKPFMPIEELIQNWGNRAVEFTRLTGSPTGWNWTGMLGHSDMLALAGLILLSSVVIAAYLGLLVSFIQQRRVTYILLVLLQLGVFALAAMDLGGGH